MHYTSKIDLYQIKISIKSPIYTYKMTRAVSNQYNLKSKTNNEATLVHTEDETSYNNPLNKTSVIGYGSFVNFRQEN